jgi:hypothetical protein
MLRLDQLVLRSRLISNKCPKEKKRGQSGKTMAGLYVPLFCSPYSRAQLVFMIACLAVEVNFHRRLSAVSAF